MKRNVWLLLSACLAGLVGSVSAAPYVTNVIVRQQWPWSSRVNVYFGLADVSSTAPADIRLSVQDGAGASVTVDSRLVTGRWYALTEEKAYQLSFDPVGLPALQGKTSIPQFTVTVTPSLSDTNITGEVLYKIFCLTDNSVTNVTRVDLLNGRYGAADADLAWISNSSVKTNADAHPVVWFEVTNNAFYSTDAIVLRKIPAGSFQMGDASMSSYSTSHKVTFNHDFWIGVFEVTQAQWIKVMGGDLANYFNFSDDTRKPANTLGYLSLRESTNSARGAAARVPAYGWPTNSTPQNPIVSDWSFMGRMRKRFPGTLFDLPTSAQWEYACRAGTTVPCWNDGSAYLSRTHDTNLDQLGRYTYNGGCLASNSLANPGTLIYYTDMSSKTNNMAVVGRYRPNAWGLFDMHGNALEWCLDAYATVSAADAIDPPGPQTLTGSHFILGGYYSAPAEILRPALRSGGDFVKDITCWSSFGFRLAIPHHIGE